MRKEGFLPGPKAYHALVYSYVKGGDPRGGLKAIRQEANNSESESLSKLFFCLTS